MSRGYRVAVIGLGVGRGHIEEAYSVLGGQYDLALVCDLDEARLSEAMQTYGVAGTRDFEAVLARENIDIVDICTPSWLHVPQAIAALEAGKHVILEKPVAGSLAEIDALRRAEAAAPGVLMPIFQYRWGQGAMAARAIIDAGLAGQPLTATAETHWFRESAYYAAPWRGTWKGELGGTMTTHAVHALDMICWLMGPVASVYGCAATLIHDIETEDTASATLRFRSGALASLSACARSQDEYSRLFLAFENVSFESTREPYAVGRGPWTITARDPEIRHRIDRILAAQPDVGDRFGGQMAAFHTALEAGAPPPVTLDDAEAAIALLTAFYRSTQTGQPIDLPLAPDDPARNGWMPGNNLT